MGVLSFCGPHKWVGIVGFQGQEAVHEILSVLDIAGRRSLVKLVLKPRYRPMGVNVVFSLPEYGGNFASTVEHSILDFASKHSDVFGDIELHIIEVKLVAVRLSIVQSVGKIS